MNSAKATDMVVLLGDSPFIQQISDWHFDVRSGRTTRATLGLGSTDRGNGREYQQGGQISVLAETIVRLSNFLPLRFISGRAAIAASDNASETGLRHLTGRSQF